MHIIRGRAADRPTRKRSKTFTGQVWGDPLMPQTPDGDTINSVTFAPGARSYWHRHTGGQILVVTAGQGWVCVEGGQPEVIRNGDVVWTPPGEKHWHGATPTTIMTHLGITIGHTDWLDEVADYEYQLPD
ncbi:MAG TPA: cupin domain-containing protein [Pseudonocardia sp.]|nr:cupin domain-containing protein [Pseudonocardia sp.]